MRHLTREQLDAGLNVVRESPRDGGVVEMIVRRPGIETRQVLEECRLDSVEGLVGDNWYTRGSSHTPDGSSDPETQLTLMNSRVICLIAQTKERWPLAGDQLYIDMDLSAANLPPGTQITLGGAVIEVSAQPHTGCKKFVTRFGLDAMSFVNSKIGRELNLRGVNARVIQSGVVRVGDVATKSQRRITNDDPPSHE